jgi:cytochrome c oxidase cbb3-type subunit 4
VISKVLSGIEGVAAYPLVSLLIFLPFFIIVTVVIFKMKKSDVDEMSRIPFDDNEPSE